MTQVLFTVMERLFLFFIYEY